MLFYFGCLWNKLLLSALITQCVCVCPTCFGVFFRSGVLIISDMVRAFNLIIIQKITNMFLYSNGQAVMYANRKQKTGRREEGELPQLFKWHHVIWILFLSSPFLSFLPRTFFFSFFRLRRRIIGTPLLPPPGQAAQDLGRFTSANTFGHWGKVGVCLQKGPFVHRGSG